MKHLYEYLEFSELSDDAKKTAIDYIRDEKERGNFGGDDLAYLSVEDDALFEPSDKEMEELFGDDYYHANGDRFMIKNTRKNISFISKSDPNYYIHCEDALDVTNDNLFYRWLGIPIRHSKDLYYTFKDGGRNSNTTIDFEIDLVLDLVFNFMVLLNDFVLSKKLFLLFLELFINTYYQYLLRY